MSGPRLKAAAPHALRNAHLDAARRATGCDDFGSDDFLEPLEIILDDLVHRAHLSARGRLLTPYYIQRLLRLRLQVWRATAGRPALPPPRPVFILGLPRTGSTLLHELLALHPRLRAPTFWQCHYLPRGDWHDPATRALTRAQVAAVNVLAPELRRIHPLTALGPHECVSIHALSFRSMQFHAAYRLPTYDAWMRDSFDWRPAYTWHQRHLAMLNVSPGGGTGNWVLKAPAHMLGIQALWATYPDARFIALHRDPLEVIPSMASLTLALRRITSRRHDLAEIGRDVDALWLKGLTNFMQARDGDPGLNARTLDVPYLNMVREPETMLRNICAFIEAPWDDGFADAVARHLAANPKDRHGVHRYTLEQFDLEPEALRAAYEPYVERFVDDGRE